MHLYISASSHDVTYVQPLLMLNNTSWGMRMVISSEKTHNMFCQVFINAEEISFAKYLCRRNLYLYVGSRPWTVSFYMKPMQICCECSIGKYKYKYKYGCKYAVHVHVFPSCWAGAPVGETFSPQQRICMCVFLFHLYFHLYFYFFAFLFVLISIM